MKQYVSAGEHHDGDNASAPVSSVTQLDIWLSVQENTRMSWSCQHAGGFLHHGNDHRNEIHRTISDPKRETVSSCTRGDWREPSRLACPCVQTSAENTPLSPPEQEPALPHFNSPHQHRILLSSHLNKFRTAVQWYARQFRIVGIKVLRSPEIK